MRSYLIVLVVLELFIAAYFYSEYLQKIAFYHEKSISFVKNSLRGSIETFAAANDNFHAHHSQDIASLVSEVGSSQAGRDRVREKLLNEYMGFYSDKKLNSFGGMHIFDADGYSLLRFHKPKYCDDAIVQKRESIERMGRDFIYKNGLEVGIFDVTYRFQYPLFYDGLFIGSYEYSLDYNALLREMNNFLAGEYSVLLERELVDEVLPKDISQKKFLKLNIGQKEFYFTASSYKNSFDLQKIKYLQKCEEFVEMLHKREAGAFDFSYEHQEYSLIYYPLDDINKKPLGSLIAIIKESYSIELLQDFLWKVLVTMLLSTLIYFYFIKQLKHKSYVRNLLNLQKDILLVTDGESIQDANRAFLAFFDFKSVKEFSKEHACICDFFLEEKGFLHKDNDGVSWIDYIKSFPEEKHRVKINKPNSTMSVIFELELEQIQGVEQTFLVFKDITQDYYLSEELENRANYDSLTHIYNRARFEKELHQELEKTKRYKTNFTLIMFDIDYFKSVNDSYGHDIGDSVLKELSEVVKHAIREIDFFARWGGEEFMIISHGSINESEVFAEKLRQNIEAYNFSAPSTITCSFGITQYHEGDTKEHITKRVDKMLYSAKEAGRNCVVSLR